MSRPESRVPVVGALLLLLAASCPAAEKPKVAGVRLGIGDQYKLGCWTPLWVSVEGGEELAAVSVVATTPDSDGVGVATTTPGDRPLSTVPGETSQALLYVRVGQQNSPVDVQLFSGGHRLDGQKFTVGAGDTELIVAGEELPLPTTSAGYLVLQLGAECGGAEASEKAREAGDWSREISVGTVTDIAQLPRDAIGYEGFNVVVLAAGARASRSGGGWLASLTPNDPRVVALIEWVELGGRLVLSCGASGADLLGQGGVLERLVPGKYKGPGALSVATAIERYTDSVDEVGSIDLVGGTLPTSELTESTGVVEAYAGRSADETPLIVRSPLGFGEVTFVAVDLDAPALAGWRGRPDLMKKLLRLPQTPSGQNFVAYGYRQDLVGSLLEKLDAAFTGVRTAPFLLIVGLVVVYLLLIGPGDYFFVSKVLGRVEATWVTFPVLVALTSVAAYAGAYWLKGGQLRVNQVEVIDVDAATGQSRGLLLTHLYSPRADRYDLSLDARAVSGEPLDAADHYTSWLGRPGFGLGGMQATNSGQGLLRADYRVDPTPGVGPGGPSVAGLPVQVWSTKTLASRYSGQTDHAIEARLTPDRDGIVEGSITNDSGAKLLDCRLVYGSWSWRLGDLGDGATVTVDPSPSSLKRVTTLLGKAPANNPYGANRRWTTIEQIGQALSIGARASDAEGAASRYLHQLDLTHCLDAGKALLLARVEGPCSELITPDGPLADDEPSDGQRSDEGPSRKSWVFVRYLLDVSTDEE